MKIRDQMKINVHLAAQQLELLDDAGNTLRRYSVSTAANGAGETCGSHCTPRGKHIIRAKIGAAQPENTVFVRRRLTGEIYTPELGAQFPERDWILTRILWFRLEPAQPARRKRYHAATSICMARQTRWRWCPARSVVSA